MKHFILPALLTALLLALPPLATAAPLPGDWAQLTAVGGGTQSQLQPSHWPYDQYPGLPEVTPKSKTLLLDVDGPGVLTLLHVSMCRGAV